MPSPSITRRHLLAALAAPQRRPDVLAGMQEAMGPLPRLPKGAPRHELLEETREPGLIRRLIRFEAEPGDMVPAWLLLPERPHARGLTALCLHQTTRIGKDEPAGLGGKPNLHYARELTLRGFATLSPDYPNYGSYQFDPYAHGYISATMKGIVNHMRALSLLGGLRGVHRNRIAVCGHSLGGHNSLFLAAFDQRARAVVTSCGFTSFARYYGGNLKGWSHKGYMPRIESEYGCDPTRMPFDFPGVLSAIAPRPLFINAPVHDANFDPAGVDDCVNAVRPLYRHAPHLRLEHPDAGHDFPPEVRQRAWQFLESVL
ncbi:MAG: alpha/beta fold hydrolase [Acidobacteria bacterium]|nr:alpha/beta fold hydrolase [Acidobacteriota bacterium]